MILSRLMPALRISQTSSKNLIVRLTEDKISSWQQIKRGSHDGNREFFYRNLSDLKPSQSQEKKNYILGAIFWWWVLWHVFTEYEELYGPVLPNPSKFTDEELGIPPI